MDISQVYMVRSAKGNDMLCVDSFLYYYDDRGIKSYRWSCSKRKDKVAPCKSRIITKLVDFDETKHAVIKVFEDHSHDKCSPEEISKAFERKRIANLEGKPCTLEAKAEKRKLLKQDEDSEQIAPMTKKACAVKVEPSKDNDSISALTRNTLQKSSEYTCLDKLDDKITSSQQEDAHVYVLTTTNGREMVSINGYLYRLEGTGINNKTYRWECSRRRDDGCKARLQTLRMRNGRHSVKQHHFNHTHPPYAKASLSTLIGNQYPLNNSDIRKGKTEEFEKIDFAKNCKLLKDTKTASPKIETHSKKGISFGKQKTNEDELYYASEDGNNMREQETNNFKPSFGDKDKNVDPLEANERSIAPILDLTRIRFLPSSKGNNMLCIDNFLYHFDSRSSNKQRVYWTCIHRRDKRHNCKARITSDSNMDSNIKIMKVSGLHMHPNDTDKINERLYNDLVVRAAHTSDVKPRDFLNSSITDLNDDVKHIVENSKDTIRRKIARLRYKIKQRNINHVIQRKLRNLKTDNSDEDNSMSSLSSSFHSDDDEFPALPMNLDEMKSKSNDEIFADTNDDIGLIAANLSADKSQTFMQIDKKFKLPSYEKQPFADFENDKFSDDLVTDMDLTKISTVRSAKGGELLCIDDYLYHVKSARDVRTYWECIKSKDKVLQCKSRVTTNATEHGYVVKKVTNLHSHEVSRNEVEKRLKRNARKQRKQHDTFELSGQLNVKSEKKISEATTNNIKMRKCSADTRSVMKLYSVSDGPPSLAVQMTLKALKIPYELVNIDFCAGEHMTEEYERMNPQKEIPVLDDDGFFLSESIAIMQYLCDKYAPQSTLYPKEAALRSIVNHRLCFNMGFYYASISAHVMAPIFFDYPRNEMTLMKVNNALSVFEKYLERSESKYVACNHLTIADFPLVTATICLEAIDFDLSAHPLVKQWYENFKKENPELWQIGNDGLKEIQHFEKNPPDLSNLNHPFHPARKVKN